MLNSIVCALNGFTCSLNDDRSNRKRKFEKGAVAADAAADVLQAAQDEVGTLSQFLDWFRVTF